MSGENTLEFIIYIAIKNTEARYQIEYLKTKGYLIFPVHVRGKNGFTKKKKPFDWGKICIYQYYA